MYNKHLQELYRSPPPQKCSQGAVLFLTYDSNIHLTWPGEHQPPLLSIDPRAKLVINTKDVYFNVANVAPATTYT